MTQPALTSENVWSIVDDVFRKTLEMPRHDECRQHGYVGSAERLTKILNEWAKTNGVKRRKPGGNGKRSAEVESHHKAVDELEGVEDLEERKRIVREMSAKERKGAYV